MTKYNEVFFHDTFNLVALTVICYLDLYYLYISSDFSAIGTPLLGQGHRALFSIFYNIFATYLLVDTAWVFLQPKCVASTPKSIIFHHIATMTYIIIPYFDEQFSWHMAICLTVEINTLMLTIRRNVPKNSLIYQFTDLSFNISWVILRLILYPILVYFMWIEYRRYTSLKNTWMNMMIIAPIFQSLLTLLSLKWTYDLGYKKFVKSDKINVN